MINFCKVEVEITVDGKVIKSRVWPEVDIMRTGYTRAWATRQFNAFLKDFAASGWRDKVIRAYWTAHHGEAQGYGCVRGSMGGVNGFVSTRRGVFEE